MYDVAFPIRKFDWTIDHSGTVSVDYKNAFTMYLSFFFLQVYGFLVLMIMNAEK